MNVEIKPFIAEVDDYHEFKSIKRIFSACGITLEYEGVGFDGYYKAVFWIAGDEAAAFEFMMVNKDCLKFIAEDEYYNDITTFIQ